MPSEISLDTAIDIALKAKLKRDLLGCAEGIEFDARPEEVYQTLRILASNVGAETSAKEELKDMAANLRSLADDLYATAVDL